jgi:hypothetical protein
MAALAVASSQPRIQSAMIKLGVDIYREHQVTVAQHDHATPQSPPLRCPEEFVPWVETLTTGTDLCRLRNVRFLLLRRSLEISARGEGRRLDSELVGRIPALPGGWFARSKHGTLRIKSLPQITAEQRSDTPDRHGDGHRFRLGRCRRA